MNAVIYARFSSHNQTEQSIEGQLRYCNQYAKQYGYNVIGNYIDRALSGTSDNRPQFQEMIKDSQKKQFQFVIVWKLDRFARNRYDSAIYKNKLKKNGVKVLSATEGIGEGDESIILEAVLEAMAETYSKQLSQNVKRGMYESALKCNSTGGTVPLGYKRIDSKLTIDTEKARIVKYIFEEYAKGTPKKVIVENLNGKGYRTQNGSPFVLNSIGHMLNNKKYIGVYHYKDIETENGCPAIISKGLFEQCQKRAALNKRKRNNYKSKVEYLLTGKLFCGHCGATMTADSGQNKDGRKYYYYTCSTKKKNTKSCDKKRESKDFIEWYLVEQAISYVLTPQRIDIIAQRVVDEYNKDFSNNKIVELEKCLKKLNCEFDKLTDTLINAKSKKMIERINQKAEEVELQITETEKQIAEQKLLSKAKISADDIKNWLQRFCNGDLTDKEFQKQIIDVLINSIFLFDNKIVVYYNIKDGKQITYTDMLEDVEGVEGVEFSESSKINSQGQPVKKT